MRDALHKVMNSSWWDCSQVGPNLGFCAAKPTLVTDSVFNFSCFIYIAANKYMRA